MKISLRELLRRVYHLPPMTKEERDKQRISFVYGNLNMSNPNITREMVEKAAEKLDNESD